MYTIYLDKQGSHLGLAQSRLTLSKDGTDIERFPVEQVDQVWVFGNVQISAAALAGLLERGIPVLLLNSRGRLRGAVQGVVGGQVKRRARQYLLLGDWALALPLARALVVAKIRNQHRLLQVQLGRTCGELHALLESAQQAPDAMILRGVEGTAARLYFAYFPELLAGSPFTFSGRNKHPPRDPVNALLSLSYTLLLGELQAAALAYGLDPFAGVYHAGDGSQPSCLLDLMEPLRCVADRMVIRLARHNFQPADFVIDEAHCLLADGRRGILYRAWEEQMSQNVRWRGRQHTYRQIIHAQAGALASCLDNPQHPLAPFLLHQVGEED